MKVITFVLPQYPLHISGGYKIAFSYANKLVKDGYKVNIVFFNDGAPHFLHIPTFFKNFIMNELTKKKIKWYPLDSRIHCISSTNRIKMSKAIKGTNIVIATAAITVDMVLKKFKNSKKIYLIQGFEEWDMTPRQLYKTYNAGLINVVISNWLKNIVSKHTNKIPIYIRNPIDTKIYKITKDIRHRDPCTIGMLYHLAPYKGVRYSLLALKKVRKKYPNLEVIMFGSAKRPKHLPKWITYYKNVTADEAVEIYNAVSIFVCGSVKEGFGLTGLEAMACGDALVSTNYLGVREYAVNKMNALLSPVKDINKLANNIIYLIENKKERVRIAEKGNKDAQLFSWENAYAKFKDIIEKL